MGATSLIVWTLISLVAIKYAIIVLRADDAGNGESLQNRNCNMTTRLTCLMTYLHGNFESRAWRVMSIVLQHMNADTSSK